MRLIPLLLLICCLAACAGGLVKKADPLTVQVTWVRVAPPGCGDYQGPFGGCAWRSQGYTQCTIYMPEDANDYVIAEEFKHCFGWEHS